MRRNDNERGMTVAMVMAVLIALTLAGAVGLGLMMGGLRTSGTHRTAARALFCAEAGLAAGRAFFAANVGQLNLYLQCQGGGACPAGYPLTGSAAPDGSASFEVRMVDNYDELPPTPNNPSVDSDLTVILISRCTDPLLPPRVLRQPVSFDILSMPDYRSQAGAGRAHAGNQN